MLPQGNHSSAEGRTQQLNPSAGTNARLHGGPAHGFAGPIDEEDTLVAVKRVPFEESDEEETEVPVDEAVSPAEDTGPAEPAEGGEVETIE